MEDYGKKLGKMINCETVYSSDCNTEKFIKFWEVNKTLFPNVFKKFTLEQFSKGVLLSYIVKSDKKPILFMSHSDVVDPNGNWDTNPFEAMQKDGCLFGRGTLDTKGNLFAILQSIEELLIENYSFDRSIYIESSFDEEYLQEGAKEIAEELHKRGIEFEFVSDEGGMIVDNIFGKSDKRCAMIALGEKACVEVKITCRINGGHASTPAKDNPLNRLAKFMVDVEKHIGFKCKLDDNSVYMLKKASVTMNGVKKTLFKHSRLFRWLITKVFSKLSPVTHAMVSSTLCFTRIHGSEANNIIPSDAYAIANIRVSHHQRLEDVKRRLFKIANKYHLEVEYIDPGMESPICSYKNKAFQRFSDIIENTFDNVIALPYIATGASDAKYMNLVSKNVFRFAPFTISDEQLETIHSVNENVTISAIKEAVDFFKKLIKEY